MKIIDNKLYLNDVIMLANDSTMDYTRLKNKSILITGASGMICSFLVDVLMYRNANYNDNIKIFLLARDENKLKNRFGYYNLEKVNTNSNNSNLLYIIQDVCEPFTFDLDFDYIINGASNTHPKQYSLYPVETIETNVIGMNNILNYCIKHKATRIIAMSSVEVYGENRGDIEQFNELYLGYINCNTLRAGYPESKRLCESLCQAYISQYNMDIVIGRLSRIYGPTLLKNDTKVITQFIKNVINNEDIVLKSEGNQQFSYLHVADAVSAILALLFKGNSGEAYNIADSRSNIKLKDIASLLAKMNNKNVIYDLPDEIEKKGYSTASKALLDSTKINNLGWNAYYDIKTGLEKTIEILKAIGW